MSSRDEYEDEEADENYDPNTNKGRSGDNDDSRGRKKKKRRLERQQREAEEEQQELLRRQLQWIQRQLERKTLEDDWVRYVRNHYLDRGLQQKRFEAVVEKAHFNLQMQERRLLPVYEVPRERGRDYELEAELARWEGRVRSRFDSLRLLNEQTGFDALERLLCASMDVLKKARELGHHGRSKPTIEIEMDYLTYEEHLYLLRPFRGGNIQNKKSTDAIEEWTVQGNGEWGIFLEDFILLPRIITDVPFDGPVRTLLGRFPVVVTHASIDKCDMKWKKNAGEVFGPEANGRLTLKFRTSSAEHATKSTGRFIQM